jgi:phytoene dehydrogenase-like protein
MLNRRATFNSTLLIYYYSMSNEFDNSDVIIIGGGLAGLTTAALLARSGKIVTLFERSSKEIGGRARTTEVDGFYFNQGPHALFLTDSTDSILKEIGITYTGGIAGGKSYLISSGKKHEVPGDYGSWLSSGKGDGSSVVSDEIQFFNSPTNLDFSQLEGVTVQEWLDKNIHDINDAEIIKAILRLNTYGNDPEIQSIGSALRQIYVNSRAGTMYLDGGWQTLVDGLLIIAKNANTRIVMDKKAISVKRTNSSGWQVLLSDKTQVSAKIVVIAAGPMDAYSLFDDKERPEVLSKAAKAAKPVRLVCLDVALSSLPDKDALFALGVDRPLYFSVHSAYAKLAPEGGALIHVAKYLGTSIAPKPREDQPELEELLDLMQPGWRQVLVKKRPLPSMVVSNAVASAAAGGLAGRPDAKIADNLYIVGDWVGKEGLLSNASVASAKHAAQLILNE